MRVCFQIDHLSNEPCGVWWEIDQDEVDCEYVDPVSTVALAGVMQMMTRPKSVTWWQWWDMLAGKTSQATWFEIVEVDDESYGYELLYHLPMCHPRVVRGDTR